MCVRRSRATATGAADQLLYGVLYMQPWSAPCMYGRTMYGIGIISVRFKVMGIEEEAPNTKAGVKIAVIGAGLTGLLAAQGLKKVTKDITRLSLSLSLAPRSHVVLCYCRMAST